MLTARADVVGSLLRPAELLEARKGLLSGTLCSEKFKAIEDRAVDRAIALQEEVGPFGLPGVQASRERRTKIGAIRARPYINQTTTGNSIMLNARNGAS